MIKNFIPQKYEGANPLPNYASNVRQYALLARVPGNYTITLAKITVGESVSAGNQLAHVMFESFTSHGERRKITRTRASGYDREFNAIKNAMIEAGVEFNPTVSSPCETVLRSLGEWFQQSNPEIIDTSLVSQTCH